jgi:TetR/AcrR family transcriptional repressor of nem operon
MARTREFDEAVVLETAMSLFWRNGFKSTSMSDLARATGLQRGSLYNAYRDKETLFLRVFESYARRFLAAAEEAVATGSLEQRLVRLFEAAIANMRGGEPPLGCLTTRTIMESAAEHPATRKALRGLLTGLEAIVERALVQARAAGEFDGEPRETARFLVSVTRGMAVVERAFDDEARLREIARKTVRLLVDRS